jgi:hypothetical protein
MPFQKGQPRPANAGRRAGTGNKATVIAILAGLKCDPIEGMARIAMDAKQKPELRGRMFAELAKYRYPQLKAIEHTGAGGGPIEIHDSAREELARRIAGLAARLGASGDIERSERG